MMRQYCNGRFGPQKHILTLAVLLAVFAAQFFLPMKVQAAAPAQEQTVEATVPDTEEDGAPWEKNVLENLRSFIKGNMYYDENYSIPGNMTIPRSKVQRIVFLDSLEEKPSFAWDASEAKDGSVWAWTMYKNAKFNLIIAAEGGVCLPEDCTDLFKRYTKLTEVEANGNLHVSENTTDLSNMFTECGKLESVELSGLETKNVRFAASMFRCCKSLKNVDLSGWDTGNLLTTANMFHGCKSLTELDLSGFDTRQVLDMGGMFYGCDSLTDLNLGQWETDSVYNSAVFMNPEAQVNGEPWENLFQ